MLLEPERSLAGPWKASGRSFNHDAPGYNGPEPHFPAHIQHSRSTSRSPLPASFGSASLRPSPRAPSPSVASVVGSTGQQQYRVQDFENVISPLPRTAAVNTQRPTCYTPEPPSLIEDFPDHRSVSSSSRPSSAASYRQSFNYAKKNLFDSCNKLPLTPPSSRPPSPSKLVNSTPEALDRRASVAGGAHARQTSKASLFDNAFALHATSSPVRLISSSRSDIGEFDEEQELRDEMEIFTRSPQRTRTRLSPTMQSTNPASKLAGWFSRATTHAKEVAAVPETVAQDPLLNLDVDAALFPHGPADPLDPSSFHDLVLNAESLIQRYQLAYRAKHYAFEDLRSEQDVQDEELNEAETRARHLKMQLDDMAAKAIEQQREVEELMQELERERRGRQEDEQRRRMSVRVVHDGAEQAKRRDTVSAASVSDSGFESGADSEDGDSVFSESHVETSDSNDDAPIPTRNTTLNRSSAPKRERPQSVAASLSDAQEFFNRSAAPADLRGENSRLRARVSELEQAVDSCLDLVACFGR